MLLFRQPSSYVSPPTSAFDSKDVVIANSLQKSSVPGRDTAISTASSMVNTVIQCNQTEFDWMYNTNAFQRLKHLITLKDNWDGYGAKRFTIQHIRRALDLFAIVQSHFNDRELNFSHLSPFVAPCSDGAILFEWGGKRFPERELEIFVPANPDDPFEYLKNYDDINEDGSFTETNLTHTLLEWLLDSKI